MSPIHSHPRHLLVRLQLDWDHLIRSRAALRRARGWSLVTGSADEPVRVESLDDVLRSAGYGRGAGSDDDRVLAQLVRLAATDQLAARVVLQRLLPGISSLARRRAAWSGHRSDLLDEVVASAWTVIRTYPVERRGTYVAASMLREIDYQSFRRPHRRLTSFLPQPGHTFDTVAASADTPTAADELRDLLADAAAAGVDATDIDLARRLGRGESTKQIAASRKVTDRTVRNHRDIVAHRLRAVALATATA